MQSELAIVGDGPQRAYLETLAEGLQNVRFMGEKPPDAVAGLLGQADLFILPSVDLDKQAEGTPTSLMEAMATGLPIVSTDAGGIRYLVRDGIHGLMVPQRDPAALAEAIVRLASEPELRRAMGERNRRAVEGRAWPAIAKQVETVYRQALGRNHSSPGPRGA